MRSHAPALLGRTRGVFAQICVTTCGGSDQPRCGCDAGVSTVPLDPVRPAVVDAIDAYGDEIADRIETLEAAIEQLLRGGAAGLRAERVSELAEAPRAGGPVHGGAGPRAPVAWLLARPGSATGNR